MSTVDRFLLQGLLSVLCDQASRNQLKAGTHMFRSAGWSRAFTYLHMRMQTEATPAFLQYRHFSSKARKSLTNKSQDQHELPAQSTLQTWLQAVRAVLFPITVQQPAEQAIVAKPTPKRPTTHRTTDHAIPKLSDLSRDAQHVVGNLFKGSILFISLPLAGSIVVNQLLIPNIVTRLQSDNPRIVQKALADVQVRWYMALYSQFYVRYNWLASIFEGMDGVGALLQVLRHPPATGVWNELTACLKHLSKFEATRDALSMGNVVSLLEQALTSSQIPQENIDNVYAVYLEYHAIRRQQHAAAFATVAPGIDRPLSRAKVMPMT